MKRGKIWINSPDHMDMHIITDGLEKNGFTWCRSFVGAEDEEGVIKACAGCVGVVSGMEPWNERTLAAVRDHIRIIIRYGTGYNNVDVPAATRNGIAAFNAAGRNAPAVAEVALLHILNAGRKFTFGRDMAREGKWAQVSDLDSFELSGKTVGLYGAGAIARNLAKLLQGFDVTILAYDVMENEAIKQYGVSFVSSPEELFRKSDVISLHLPLLPSTKGIVNRYLLGLMKPSAILVNTSRGPIINEEDLLEALKEKRIRAVGLDVLCQEPFSSSDPLVNEPGACVTTHMGATSYEAKVRVEECLYQTIADFFDGKYETSTPNNFLNPEVLKGTCIFANA